MINVSVVVDQVLSIVGMSSLFAGRLVCVRVCECVCEYVCICVYACVRQSAYARVCMLGTYPY